MSASRFERLVARDSGYQFDDQLGMPAGEFGYQRGEEAGSEYLGRGDTHRSRDRRIALRHCIRAP